MDAINKRIKPCPFCGSRDLGFIRDENASHIYCKRCHAASPLVRVNYENSKLDMIEDVWNKRSTEIDVYAIKKIDSNDIYKVDGYDQFYLQKEKAEDIFIKMKDRDLYMLVEIVSDEYVPGSNSLGDYEIFSMQGTKIGEHVEDKRNEDDICRQKERK